MILIREFYLDKVEGVAVYTGRDTVYPSTDLEHITKWADSHIPEWISIELFRIESMSIGFGDGR